MRYVLVLLFVLAAFVPMSGFVRAEECSRYIVTTRGPVADDVAAAGGKVFHEFKLIKAVAVDLPPSAVQALARRPNVVRVEEDAVVTAAVQGDKGGPKPPPVPPPPQPPPPQPAQVLPWGVDRIDAERCWATSKGTDVKVAVIDTGIKKDHLDLATNVKDGVNFVSMGGTVDPAKWMDDNGHGTHVAGIIGALDNGIGVVGVAPEAWLYAVKVLDSTGSGFVSDVILGIQWAKDNGIQVANMSLSTTKDVQALHDACKAAADQKVVLVAAAGNSGGSVQYPAAYSESVIAVGATDVSDNVPRWSNRGKTLQSTVLLVAPGVDVKSTWKDGYYQTLSGTSMATPHVAGTCALVVAVTPPADLTLKALRDKLTTTADDVENLGPDKVSGYGLVDAEEAVTDEQTNP